MKLEKVVTSICPCMLKVNGYYTKKEAFSPLYAFQLQITEVSIAKARSPGPTE